MLDNTEKIVQKSKKILILKVILSFAIVFVFSISLVWASDITADTVISLVNKARTAVNVAVLKKNDLLQKAAEEKAQDMIDNNYFAHISPQGKSPWDWINQSGYDYRYAGENLAINFTNAKDEQQAWMDSESHRKNILNSDYNDTGVAVKQGIIDGHETTIVVQMFGKQMQEAITSTDAVNGQKAIGASVAGAQTSNAENVSNKAQEFSNQMKLNALFKNNTLTLIGWFTIFGIAIVLILVDVAALVHKKHEPFFLEHKTHSV
jgi:hypothetical protein